MARLLLAALVLWLTASPCQASTELELGTAPHVSVHLEGHRASLGLGISVQYYEDTFFANFSNDDKIHILTFHPSAIGRLFLSDGTTRSFLEVRASKEVSSVNGEYPDYVVGDYGEFLDDWTASLGVGLRAGINERLRVAGAVDAWAEFQTFEDREDAIQGGTSFRVSVGYALSP